jgi:galactokinase
LDYDLVSLDLKDCKLVISNTNKRRGLTDSKYNERRAECDLAVELLSKKKKIRNLSELDYATFLSLQDAIADPVVRKRAKHVISENNRVLEAIKALKAGNLELLGKLMNESHDSLRDDYEVTGIELDTLVDESRKIKGVYGSRMTGAGFGGCTVSVVKSASVDEFCKVVGENYTKKTQLIPEFYIADVGNGACKIL